MQTNCISKIFRRWSFVALLHLSFSSLFAQTFDANKYIDSLRTVLPTLKDTARIKCLNRLGYFYALHIGDSARYFANMALAESEKKGYTRGLADAHVTLARAGGRKASKEGKEAHYLKAIEAYKKINNQYQLAYCYNFLAYLYKGEGKTQQALDYFMKGISLIEKNEVTPGETVEMYNSLSYYCRDIGNYKVSFEYRKKSYEFYKKTNDNFGIIMCLQSFGELFDDAGDKETATEYHQKVISFFHANTFQKNEAPTHRLVANTYLVLSNNDSALYYFNKALDYADASPWGPGLKVGYRRFVQMERAKVLLGKKQYEEAIEVVSEPLKFYVDHSDNKDMGVRSTRVMGEAYFGLKNYSKALPYAMEMYTLSKELKLKNDIKDASRLLWKIHDQLKNTDSAYFYLQEFLIAKETSERNRSFNELALFKAAQTHREQEARMELLGKENKIKEQQLIIERQNLRRESLIKKYLIAGLLSLVVLGIIVFRTVLLKRKLEAERRLSAEKELQLQKTENERRVTDLELLALRSQMNPHFIFNCLNSINRFVLRNDTEAASGYLTKFSKLMRMVLENSKQTLIPLEEEVKCLELYIQMEQFRCKNSFRYYVKYHDGVNVAEAMIPPLLLQPFVENAVWHGLNTKEADGEIGIEFLQKEETLFCVIRDNGIGRKKASELKSQLAENHKSMGLQITNERLTAMGISTSNGSLVEIEDLYNENGSATGTKVTIKIFSLPAFEELKPSLNL